MVTPTKARVWSSDQSVSYNRNDSTVRPYKWHGKFKLTRVWHRRFFIQQEKCPFRPFKRHDYTNSVEDHQGNVFRITVMPLQFLHVNDTTSSGWHGFDATLGLFTKENMHFVRLNG